MAHAGSRVEIAVDPPMGEREHPIVMTPFAGSLIMRRFEPSVVEIENVSDRPSPYLVFVVPKVLVEVATMDWKSIAAGLRSAVASMRRPPADPPRPLRRMLFWGEARGQHPRDWIRADVPVEKRQVLAGVLRTGAVGEAYMGRANCRLCGGLLGSADMHGHGFVWPQNAEHYVLDHGVWTPDCDALLAAATAP